MAYRHYVLSLLLMAYIHCILTRMLPAFLVSVPTPGCTTACAEAGTEPFCAALSSNESLGPCQECRARLGAFSDLGDRTSSWYNLRDGCCLEQWQYGLLMGYGFAVPFVLGSFVTAKIVDTANRKLLLASAIICWSLSSAIMSTARSFALLLFTRFLLSFMSAATVPTAMSLLTHYFGQGQQGIAGSILSSGVCLGAGAASWVAPLALHVGWRDSCAWMAVVGLVVGGLIATTVREPEQQLARKQRVSHATSTSSRWLCSTPSAMLLTTIASVRLAASYTLADFLPQYYVRARLPGYSASTYATANTAIVATAGLMSSLWTGVASDHFGQSRAAAPCMIAACSQAIAAIFYIGVFQAGSFAGSMACYCAALLVGEGWFGLTLVQTKYAVPAEVQGQTVTLMLSIATIVSNSSPVLIAALDPGTAQLGSVMLQLILGCLGITSLLFVITGLIVGKRNTRQSVVTFGEQKEALLTPSSQGSGMDYEFGEESQALGPRPTVNAIRSRRESIVKTITEGVVRRHTIFAVPAQTDIWDPQQSSF